MIVYYRMCGIPSTNPSPVLQGDKFALNKLCLRSFVRAFKEIEPKIVFINDFCDGSYAEMERTICPFDKEIISTQIGIHETIQLQYKLYDESSEDLVLFQECDYLFHESARPLVGAIKTLDFVSPYDHPDKYSPSEKCEVTLIDNKHFRTTISTTSTFATRREMYDKTKETFKSYGWEDHRRWVDLGSQGYKLWTPVPAIATHMVKNYLSPAIDWEKEYDTLLPLKREVSKQNGKE